MHTATKYIYTHRRYKVRGDFAVVSISFVENKNISRVFNFNVRFEFRAQLIYSFCCTLIAVREIEETVTFAHVT